jgi:quercetin dioxygenase-like cupin family protein
VKERLLQEGLNPSGWGNSPGDTYPPHSHGYDKVLVATQGSITFHLIDLGRDVKLNEGERLELPAGTTHGATVGSAGVQCLEAHLPAGSLNADPRHFEKGW